MEREFMLSKNGRDSKSSEFQDDLDDKNSEMIYRVYFSKGNDLNFDLSKF